MESESNNAGNDWLAAGSLSEDEFDQLVKLVARYFVHDVDQFDHWKMPGPGESKFFYVDFSGQTLYEDHPDVYRPMWPTSSLTRPGWSVIRNLEGEAEPAEVARFATANAANATRDYLSHRPRPGESYTVAPPPSD